MPDHTSRNLPTKPHARPKAAAGVPGSSVVPPDPMPLLRPTTMEETLDFIDRDIDIALKPPTHPVILSGPAPHLPPPIVPQGPSVSAETLLAWIDEGQR